MRDRLGFAILVAATGLFSVGVFADEQATFVSGVTVDLTCGSHVALDARSSATLEEEAQALLQSSQSNWHLAAWHFPPTEVQEEFRGAMANAHLRVTFASVRTIPSVGGPLVVRDIIVRLGAEAPRCGARANTTRTWGTTSTDRIHLPAFQREAPSP